MSVSGIQGQLLEVTVVACTKLKDTEWISRQDPYAILEYGSSKFRTRTCTDGGKNPTFQEKFVFTLIEGLRELNVVVWNSNTLTYDDFIGSGKVQLQKVLSQGFDDSSWTLQTKTGRYAGEIRLILHFASTNKSTSTHHSSSAPPYSAPSPLYPTQPPSISISGYPPPVNAYSAPHSHPPSYPPSLVAYPPPGSAAYPPASTAYPPPGSSAYPPISAAYPPSAYPPPEPTGYPPQPYPPSSVYPPHMYPPPPHGSSHYPPGPYPGAYPPPPHY